MRPVFLRCPGGCFAHCKKAGCRCEGLYQWHMSSRLWVPRLVVVTSAQVFVYRTTPSLVRMHVHKTGNNPLGVPQAGPCVFGRFQAARSHTRCRHLRCVAPRAGGRDCVSWGARRVTQGALVLLLLVVRCLSYFLLNGHACRLSARMATSSPSRRTSPASHVRPSVPMGSLLPRHRRREHACASSR